MANFRITWNFVGAQGQSWNEVYSTSGSNAADAVSTTPALIPARLAFLDQRSVFRAIRASGIAPDRGTATRLVNLPGITGDESEPAQAGSAVVLNLVGATGGSRKVWARGVSEAQVSLSQITGKDNPAAEWLAVYAAFFTALKNNNYGILTLKKPSPGPLDFKQVVFVNGSAGNGTTLLTTDVPHQIIDGQYIILANMNRKTMPGINGQWKVRVTSPSILSIAYAMPNNSTVTLPGGRLRLRDYNPLSIISSTLSAFDHYGTRTTKNPTTHSRGARRAVRIRLLA